MVVENVVEGDELRTDLAAIAAHIERLGPDQVACVITTTSCFAPCAADRVVEVVQSVQCSQLEPHPACFVSVKSVSVRVSVSVSECVKSPDLRLPLH